MAEESKETNVWRCFFCDEVFTTQVSATEHFGSGEYESETPVCIEASNTDLQKLVLTNREMWTQVQSLESQLEEAEDHIAGWEYEARRLTKKPTATSNDLRNEFDFLECRVIAAESYNVQKQVLEFHKAGSHVINDKPVLPSRETVTLRQRLIFEEFSELVKAMDTEDLVEVADAIGDLLYVVYGTAISYGMDMEPISAEIHRSNMTKFGKPGEYKDTCDASGKSMKDECGKTLKPSTFEPPDLLTILKQQGMEIHPADTL